MADAEIQELMELVPASAVVCRAGNPLCPSPEATGCDVCCVEPSFCRHCSCILCGLPVVSSLGELGVIRCDTGADEGFCGHGCHVQCGIDSGLAGSAGSDSLDVEYRCRRCDRRKDIVPHIYSMLRACQASSGTVEEVLMLLDMGLGLLRGSKSFALRCWTVGMESALKKLKNGRPLNEVWDLQEDSTCSPTVKGTPRKGKIVKKPQEIFSPDKYVAVKIREMADKEVPMELQETPSADKEMEELPVALPKSFSTETETAGAMECDSSPNYMLSKKPTGKIEKILDKRYMKTRRGDYTNYLVKWKEESLDNSWISETLLREIDPDLLKSYSFSGPLESSI